MQLQQGMHLQQAQRLVMTQELRQAIAILQMSALELSKAIEKELLENPLLERLDGPSSSDVDDESRNAWDESRADDGDDGVVPPAEEGLAAGGQDLTAPAGGEAEPGSGEMLDWDEYFDSDALLRREGRTRRGGDSEEWPPSYENAVAWEPSLSDHLTFQLHVATSDPAWRRVGAYYIGSIDDGGYLQCTTEEAARATGVSLEIAERVLTLLQSFDPAGVGARNLAECIWLQLLRRGEADERIGRVLREFLPLVAEGKISRLAALLKVDKDEARRIVDRIRSCDPRPGLNYGSGRATRYIVPDVVVEKVGEEYVVLVQEATAPRLTINRYYRDLLRRGKTDASEGPGRAELAEAEHYLRDRLNGALWFIRSIEQRRRTIHKVATCIVNRQRAFLDKGIKYLRPLTLREVAAEVGIHESTVSRATANKYVQTPQGIFEFKFFFTGAVEAQGGSRSAASVKATIAELIRKEDPAHPRSDQEIAARLAREGIQLSRRTVAKYREEMGIPPSARRKR